MLIDLNDPPCCSPEEYPGRLVLTLESSTLVDAIPTGFEEDLLPMESTSCLILLLEVITQKTLKLELAAGYYRIYFGFSKEDGTWVACIGQPEWVRDSLVPLTFTRIAHDFMPCMFSVRLPSYSGLGRLSSGVPLMRRLLED